MKFLDFVLTIENQLYAAEDSILVSIYDDFILDGWSVYHVVPTEDKWPVIRKWRKDIDKILENKTVRVGKKNMQAAQVARGALFEAALRCGIGMIDHNDVTVGIFGDTWYGYYVMIHLGVFAVNNTSFGDNSVKRKKLMRDVLRFLTEYVAMYYEGNIKHPDSKYYSDPGARMKELHRTETLMKKNGGEGLNPRDPNLKRIKDARSKIAEERVRRRMKTTVNLHEVKMAPWRLAH